MPKPDGIVTRSRLAAALRSFGVMPGDVVCAHVSMSALGLVIGGPRTVIEGILDACQPGGTLMMPTYSGDLSDPAEWRHPPVPAESIDEVRASIPAFDPDKTPTRGMGAVAEYFRTYPGVSRSPHPQSSFSAIGSHAEALTSTHPLDNRFGPTSPLGRLAELGGKVLLLGAPYDTVSLFHLSQHLVGGAHKVSKAAPVVERGKRCWVAYEDIEYPIDWFSDGVEHLIAIGIAKSVAVGKARSVLFGAADAVAELTEWRRRTGRVPD